MPTAHDLLEWMPDAVFVCDRDGEIVFANRQAEALTGYRRSELIGHKIELLVPVGLRSTHVERRRRYVAHPDPRSMGRPDSDFELRHKDGSVTSVDIALGPVGSEVVAVVRDMAERRSREQAFEHRALHDPLTDLANRDLFFDRLRQSLHAARREDGQFALVMLDVDGFKAINDVYGHSVGDDVLSELGVRVGSGLRATDTAARIGGDEFAWILPRVPSRESVHRTVEKRLAAAQQPLVVHGHKLHVGISAGIAMYPADGHDVDTLMRHADAAMYRVKRHAHAVAADSKKIHS
jgi:diguanylate cyclase